MIRGVGLDLCDISRIENAIGHEHFLERVYTEGERLRIRSAHGVRRGEIAAGMFAAKEAVAKALGTGFIDFGPDAVEILPDDRGRPTCTLYNRALELADGARVWVSITHDSGMAAAMAIVESGA